MKIIVKGYDPAQPKQPVIESINWTLKQAKAKKEEYQKRGLLTHLVNHRPVRFKLAKAIIIDCIENRMFSPMLSEAEEMIVGKYSIGKQFNLIDPI